MSEQTPFQQLNLSPTDPKAAQMLIQFMDEQLLRIGLSVTRAREHEVLLGRDARLPTTNTVLVVYDHVDMDLVLVGGEEGFVHALSVLAVSPAAPPSGLQEDPPLRHFLFFGDGTVQERETLGLLKKGNPPVRVHSTWNDGMTAAFGLLGSSLSRIYMTAAACVVQLELMQTEKGASA